MKKVLTILSLVVLCLTVSAQQTNVLDQLKSDPRKSYGTDYPYSFTTTPLTKAPRGYKPFYISHYGRHGSRYYWNAFLYREMDSLLTNAHRKHQLTPEGEKFYTKFEAAKEELSTGVSELTDLGWEQHQRIARTMYNNFPEVFKKGGNVLAIASLSGRCVISMSGFCQELVQCNPKIEIREQSSRFTLDGVVPDDRQNPARRDSPAASHARRRTATSSNTQTTWTRQSSSVPSPAPRDFLAAYTILARTSLTSILRCPTSAMRA